MGPKRADAKVVVSATSFNLRPRRTQLESKTSESVTHASVKTSTKKKSVLVIPPSKRSSTKGTITGVLPIAKATATGKVLRKNKTTIVKKGKSTISQKGKPAAPAAVSTDMFFAFPVALTRATILARPNRFIMEVKVGSTIYRCHCPCTVKIGPLKFKSAAPCLVSAAVPGRATPYTVEAVAESEITLKSHGWIGINQTRANRYFEHFLTAGAFPLLTVHGSSAKRERKLGDSRIDFIVPDDNLFIELKTPLELHQHPLYSAENAYTKGVPQATYFERLIKHFDQLRDHVTKSGGRAAVVLCYIYPAVKFVPPEIIGKTDREIEIGKKIRTAAEAASNAGVEMWQVNMEIGPTGVHMKEYFRLDLYPKE